MSHDAALLRRCADDLWYPNFADRNSIPNQFRPLTTTSARAHGMRSGCATISTHFIVLKLFIVPGVLDENDKLLSLRQRGSSGTSVPGLIRIGGGSPVY